MERTLTVLPYLVVLIAAIAMTPTNIYTICNFNVGTLEIEPWRNRAAAALRAVTRGIRHWLASLWSPRLAFGCGAVLLALLVAHLSAGPSGHLLAAVPVVGLPALKEKRALILGEAEKLKQTDGSFKDDQARTAFDAKMTEVDTLDAEIRAAEAAPPTAGDPAVREQAAKEERARIVGIQDAVRVAKLDATVAADMVARGLTLAVAREEIFRKLAERSNEHPTTSHLTMGDDAKDKMQRGCLNWMLVRSGAADVVAKHEKIDVRKLDPGEFRGMSLVDLAREFLVRADRPVRGLDRMRLVADALTFRGGDIYQSTSDFATLLENTLNKVLQAQYAITPDTWRRFCNISANVDFRAANRYRWGNLSVLDSLTEAGEFKNKALSDAEKASITLATKGNIIGISRQMIINDDMNAFARLPMMMGRAAALSVEVDVYALLAQNSGDGPTLSDSVALFHTSSHGANKTTGLALSAAALDLDRVAMASQKEPGTNDFTDLRPAILLLPVSLGGQARVINTSQYDPDTVANKSQMKPNLVAGLFRDIVDTPRITGTRRYLFADPTIAPVIEVAFLEGQTSPVLETQDGWRVDGAEMKVRFDYGVAGVDFRGAVTNAGV